jgi:hypothetical protein
MLAYVHTGLWIIRALWVRVELSILRGSLNVCLFAPEPSLYQSSSVPWQDMGEGEGGHTAVSTLFYSRSMSEINLGDRFTH